ncbi:MAG: type IV toxin-antitoxin system AbiEi family antitoxin domain-containing protein, partial [Nocardioides sp.]
MDLTNVVFRRADALADGYTDHQISQKVRSGAWHRVRRGAYVSGELWRGLSPADRHRVLARAVLLTSHPLTVLTHLSSALERGAPVYNVSLAEVHTTRMDGKAGRREAGKVQHRGVLPTDQVQLVNDVPVSSAPRCAVEMTTIADVESALVTANGLLHSGQLTTAEFADIAHETRYWPASLATNLVVRLADPRLESAGETRTDYLCWAQHLPRPTPQVGILDEHGNEFAWVDFAWPELG